MMRVLAVGQRPGARTAVHFDLVLPLQLFAVTVMIFPADIVIKAVGADGYVAALVAYGLFLIYVAAVLFGLHNPLDYRSPVRISLWALWLSSLVSYILMNRAILTSTQQASADRWLMQLTSVSGVILVAAECLGSLEDIRRVLRAFTWAGAFCGIVAALQFWLTVDITRYLQMLLPGFSLNQADAFKTIITRGGLNRVVGTATTAIELGVVAGMLLPLALYLAIHDVERSKVQRWFPVICISLAAVASVSRSAFMSVGIGLGVFIVLMRPAQRLMGLAAIPLAVAAISVVAHGLLGTLKSLFFAGTSDPSVANRVNNYPIVKQMVKEAPWFGMGPATYIAPDLIHVLDNQYLTTALELGLVGVAALIFFFLWPALAALVARSRTADPELRDLCAALLGSELAATVCSGTFDSLSFPMFFNVQALIVGLIGAAWLLVDRESKIALEVRSFGRHVNGALNSRPQVGTQVIERGGNLWICFRPSDRSGAISSSRSR